MNLVADANTIFASLIKNSKTAELLLNKNLKIYIPEFFLQELIKYSELIAKKTDRDLEDFYKFFDILIAILTPIPNSETEEFLRRAIQISPDIKDIDYFALALKLNCPIWSNDKKLKEQNTIKIYSTSDLVEFLNSENLD
jgi:predicted nucleic acid-binding protein